MIVVDASVFVHALLNPDPLGTVCRDALEGGNRWIAPQHWTVEVLSVIRRFARAGTITTEQAARAVTALEELDPEVPVTRVLVPRMWALPTIRPPTTPPMSPRPRLMVAICSPPIRGWRTRRASPARCVS